MLPHAQTDTDIIREPITPIPGLKSTDLTDIVDIIHRYHPGSITPI